MEVFLDMEEHKKNIELFLEMGGDAKLANRYRLPSLQNRAKIVYLISKFPKKLPKVSTTVIENIVTQNKSTNPEPEIKLSKPKGLGLIAQYPVELHESYQLAYQSWISVCSLKIQLNNLEPGDDVTAFKIQTEMLYKMDIFDKNKSHLDYYNQFKRLMPTTSNSDFSQLSPIQLLTKRNSLRSLITRRKQTIYKMISELPEESSPDYHKKLSAINRKKEKLEFIKIDEKTLSDMIK